MKSLVLPLALLLSMSLSSVSLAQSGSTGGGGGSVRISSGGSSGRAISSGRSVRRPRVSAREQALNQQRQQEQYLQNQELQKEALVQLRHDFMVELGAQPDSSQNRRQRQLAFKEAKKEYIALKKMDITLSEASRFLQEPFRLTSKELDQTKGEIHWPKPLLEPDHEEAIAKIENAIGGEGQTVGGEKQDLDKLLSEVSRQLGERVLSRDITSADYANAKRFLTGISNDAKFQ